MSTIPSTFSTLLDVARGRPVDDLGPARRLRLALAGGLASLSFAAVWGLAAGSNAPDLALANAIKVPMVVLLSALSAVPAGLLALRLSSSRQRPTELLLSFSSAVFTGTLVAAVLAPIVAIYYQTSAWAGPYLAMGSAFAAIGMAVVLFLRAGVRAVGDEVRGAKVPSFLVLALVMLVSLPQLIALASPILPETTVFDDGVDTIALHEGAR